MRIIKLNYDISEYVPSKYEGEGLITIEIGDKIKYYNAAKWVTGKWLQGFTVSFFRSDIEHPRSGSNKYISNDNISAIQKEGQGEWIPIKWAGETGKYIVAPELALTGRNNMKIRKTTQDSMQNFIRFDKDARVEIFVEEYELEFQNQYKTIIAQTNITDAQKIAMLKELCVEIAYEKLRNMDASSGIKVTIDSLSLQDINIDRIRWENVLDPDRGL